MSLVCHAEWLQKHLHRDTEKANSKNYFPTLSWRTFRDQNVLSSSSITVKADLPQR